TYPRRAVFAPGSGRCRDWRPGPERDGQYCGSDVRESVPGDTLLEVEAGIRKKKGVSRMKILAEFSYEELFVLYELVSIDEMRRLLREENAYWVLPSGA